MSRTAFRVADVERALRASQRANVPVAVRISRTSGDLWLVPIDRRAPSAQPDEIDLDAELEALLRED